MPYKTKNVTIQLSAGGSENRWDEGTFSPQTFSMTAVASPASAPVSCPTPPLVLPVRYYKFFNILPIFWR
jgi:hypothetical protein